MQYKKKNRLCVNRTRSKSKRNDRCITAASQNKVITLNSVLLLYRLDYKR